MTPPPEKLEEATLTALADGRALLAGGVADEASARAYLFDPASATWRSAAPLHHARFAHAALRLGDGRVLVVGGCDDHVERCGGEGRLASAELYAPDRDRWEPVPMPVEMPRVGHALVALADGRVLALGGTRTDSLERPPSLVWDGSVWCEAPPLLSHRHHAHATVLDDGESVIVTGHVDEDGPYIEVYHLAKECPTSCQR